MQIDNNQQEHPQIYLHQSAIAQHPFTPISALLCLLGLIIPFTVSPHSTLPFILIFSPILINKTSYLVGVGLMGIGLIWPQSSDGQLMQRILLIIDGIYILVSSHRTVKYRITPSRLQNINFPIIL